MGSLRRCCWVAPLLDGRRHQALHCWPRQEAPSPVGRVSWSAVGCDHPAVGDPFSDARLILEVLERLNLNLP